tara:strand:- start:13016 stop:13453 length:438 start_codon:yes stop_codon:yes gene_type:complete
VHKIRIATLSDVPTIALNLREEDYREVIEGFGANPLLSIASEVVSNYTVIFYTPDGKAAGMAGVSKDGCIWMLCTNAIDKFPITFIRQAKNWVNTLPHKLLYNIVDIRNFQHLKLLKHLGFKFLRIIPNGPNNLYFIEFAKLKED